MFRGNPNLKKAGTVHQMSAAQVSEYMHCAQDPIYFIENYVTIVSLDKGEIIFDLWPFQRMMINAFHTNRFVITKLPRQSGKSSTTVAYFLWCILFNANYVLGILANKGNLARILLEKVTFAYERIPQWMQQGVKTWNKGKIELENGSKILAGATTGVSIRGESYNGLLLDEFAFIDRNKAETFFNSVYPTISSGKNTKMIIVSTPNGMNHFYKYWMDAVEKKSLYIPIEIKWNDVPGRDDKFKEDFIKNTSQMQWDQEMETEFLGSVLTLINPQKLREIRFKTPSNPDKFGLDVYEEPKEKHVYVLTADVGHGVGLDYSAFVVTDVSEIPYRAVAKFRKNDISPLVYPETIVRYAKWYNNAFVLVETNDIGQQVANDLVLDLEYDNVLYTTQTARGQILGGGFGNKPKFGVLMTAQVKRIGCSNLRDLVEGNKYHICDFHIVEELTNFVAKEGATGAAKFQASPGNHDDLVMCLVCFGWLSHQPYFTDITDINMRARFIERAREEMELDVLPGFLDDGQRDEPVNLDPVSEQADRGFWNPDRAWLS